MQYKVPQNIDMEDKIVGPFTMKQFIYILAAGGIIYGWWSFLSQGYESFMLAFLLVALPVGLLGFSLALVKINDRPFEVFLLNFIRFFFGPKQRMWKRGYAPEPVIMKEAKEEVKEEEKPKDTRSLDDLAKSLEKQSSSLQEREAAKKPLKPALAAKPAEAPPTEKKAINLSVKDVKEAAEKQTQAQEEPKPKGKGFFSFLSR